MCVAAVSAFVGALTLGLARDPALSQRKPVQLATVVEHLRGFLQVPSFCIIVVQASVAICAC